MSTTLTRSSVADGCAGQRSPRHLTRKDFQSAQEVKWCPGCGDYGILAQVQNVLPRLGIPREKIVFVSGIGCSSRFPYYLNTYGIHGIHGRAPADRHGREMRPAGAVRVGRHRRRRRLSIGTNHLIHCMRRNLDVNILLFNNQIYGLTKGQYSPTSEFGKKTKSSPLGTIEQPIHPIEIALAAEATFVARTVIADPAHLGRDARGGGPPQGHVVRRDPAELRRVQRRGAGRPSATASQRDENWVHLEHGKPIRFGQDGRKGIVLRGMEPAVAVVGENGVREEDLLVHDARVAVARPGVSPGRPGAARVPHGLRHFPPGGASRRTTTC